MLRERTGEALKVMDALGEAESVGEAVSLKDTAGEEETLEERLARPLALCEALMVGLALGEVVTRAERVPEPLVLGLWLVLALLEGVRLALTVGVALRLRVGEGLLLVQRESLCETLGLAVPLLAPPAPPPGPPMLAVRDTDTVREAVRQRLGEGVEEGQRLVLGVDRVLRLRLGEPEREGDTVAEVELLALVVSFASPARALYSSAPPRRSSSALPPPLPPPLLVPRRSPEARVMAAAPCSSAAVASAALAGSREGGTLGSSGPAPCSAGARARGALKNKNHGSSSLSSGGDMLGEVQGEGGIPGEVIGRSPESEMYNPANVYSYFRASGEFRCAAHRHVSHRPPHARVLPAGGAGRRSAGQRQQPRRQRV